jgi:hypothetical protein
MFKHQKYFSSGLIALATLFSTAPIQAQTLPALGTASNFAVLSAAPNSGGAVTCTASTINGNVGSSGPMASVVQTGCTVIRSIIAPVSAQVLTDFNSTYSQYATLPCTGTLDTAYTGATLRLPPGVYCNAAAVTFTNTTLTLDGLGNANAAWIFKVGTGGTGALTGTNFSVVMANAGQPCNVSWWVAEAVTMTTSSLQGTVLAGAAITMTGLAGTTTVFNGDALAKAAVTLTNVNINSCQALSSGGNGGRSHGEHHGSDHESEDRDSDHSEHGSPFNPFNSNGEDNRSSGDHGHSGSNE